MEPICVRLSHPLKYWPPSDSCRRGQTLADKRGTPLAGQDQTPAEGHYVLIAPVHLPPTMSEPGFFGKSSAFVQMTTLDHENHRVAWTVASFPGFLLRAERWQVLSVDPSGKTKYESKEVFGGIVAWLVYLFVYSNLVLGFNAQAEGLKNRAERFHKAT